MKISEVKQTKGLWLFMAPVKGFIIDDSMNGELTLSQITFVNAKKLPSARKKLGFTCRISELKNITGLGFPAFLTESNVFAVHKLGGKGSLQEEVFLNLVREELCFLALSQLAYSRRASNSQLALVGEYKTGANKWFMWNLITDYKINNAERSGKIHALKIDKNWHENSKYGFFYDLMKIISGQELSCEVSWIADLRRAAYLAGKSQMTSDLVQAFLWNVITLEILLTSSDDKISNSLPERVEAFIGWASDWSIDGYVERIRSIYKKRCGFVHSGKFDSISIDDLLFTDNVLVNVFYNIVKHIDIFNNKNAVFEFSEKIKAEKLLGLKSSVRPKTFNFIKIHYSENDYKKI